TTSSASSSRGRPIISSNNKWLRGVEPIKLQAATAEIACRAKKKKEKAPFSLQPPVAPRRKGAVLWPPRFRKNSAADPTPLRERLVNALHRRYRKQVTSD